MDPPSPLDSKLGALVKHHYLSWIFVLVLVGIEIAAQLITPYKRYVSQYMFVTGELKYPLKLNTVPFQAVPVIALVIPLVFVLGLNFWRRSIRDTHHAVLGLFTAVLLTAAITDSVKDGIGRPRPDFYARCFGSVNGTALYDVTGNVICTGSTAVMREAYKSFPSGHTSWSFAGMGYLSMYLAGKLGIFDKKGHSWKLLPVILPLLLAIFVGVTRIDDYWHHWTDVFAGALLGLSAAYFCYRQHFPSLYDEFASQPYAIVVGTRIFHNTTLAGTNSDVPLQSDMPTYNDVERGS